MSVILILVLFSLLLALAFLGAFVISMRNGQFDDTSTPQFRMLFEDGVSVKEGKTTTKEKAPRA